MLCVTVFMDPHFYIWPLAAPCNDYIDEDLPDEDEPDASVRAPAPLIPSHTSPVANESHALPQIRKSMAGWDI
jgi:hypothetical protein